MRVWSLISERLQHFSNILLEAARPLCAGPVTVLVYDPLFRPVQLFPGDDEVFWLDTENSEASECNKLEHHRHHHHKISVVSHHYIVSVLMFIILLARSSRYNYLAETYKENYLLVFQTFLVLCPVWCLCLPPIIKRLISPDEK